ncbi:evolutionarily conserved signaling intermediate in Toll pathway, mitochondrial-like [Oncorhynchus kisutch]|uniref:evolutionarily conserved signaling intermediate in Toll pathway, mitochondrial-like n=1 Tax=Oncorhynchus kisutch TaxID=8019 RepID=UPI0012DBEA41|nr:evolutionarily conserved signaling intermediate in Toll pathway, mitochondrial-like [Oncorhynchus kisutch]
MLMETKDEDRIHDRSLITHDDLFDRVARKAKTKATFNGVVDVFSKRGIWRRGHVEFIYAALKKVPEFGVERDLTVYNKLLDVFPKEVFVPRNFIQCMFNHYPRHQECGVHLLEQMENSGGWGVGGSGMLVFYIYCFPHDLFQQRWYHVLYNQFKHANPFPVPLQLPGDLVDLASLSLNRIVNNLYFIYQLSLARCNSR